ncbi:MAG: BrnT family toxin [Planctomycetes bacterium]|nr:BrnT family toxin [Planctomycetota bacterium]
MEIHQIIWLDEIVEKIESKHGVDVREVEEVLLQDPEVRRGQRGTRIGEDIYYALGQTYAGRYLFVVFIRKSGNAALVLTARDMSDREKRGHRRRKRHG